MQPRKVRLIFIPDPDDEVVVLLLGFHGRGGSGARGDLDVAVSKHPQAVGLALDLLTAVIGEEDSAALFVLEVVINVDLDVHRSIGLHVGAQGVLLEVRIARGVGCGRAHEEGRGGEEDCEERARPSTRESGWVTGAPTLVRARRAGKWLGLVRVEELRSIHARFRRRLMARWASR